MKFLDDGLEGMESSNTFNQSMSRSAGLGLLYLAHIGQFHDLDFLLLKLDTEKYIYHINQLLEFEDIA